MNTFKIKSFSSSVSQFVEDRTIETVLCLSDFNGTKENRACYVTLSSFRARGNDYGKNFDIKSINCPFSLTVDDIQNILRIASSFNQKIQETVFTSI